MTPRPAGEVQRMSDRRKQVTVDELDRLLSLLQIAVRIECNVFLAEP
jgi:hypothetical protein